MSRFSVENVAGHLRCRRIAPLLVPYADDRLRRAERERVEAHLETCPSCRAEARTIAGVGALLRDEAMRTTAPTADLSPNLWAGIEAEIRRGGVPLDRSSESPLLRPRRRAGLAWDAAWPSSVPVATAVFSAIVFGTVLLNHHALVAPTASVAPTAAAKSDAAITVAIRPSAPVIALAASSAVAPVASVERRAAPVSLARAKTAEPQTPRLPAASRVHRSAPITLQDVLVAALPHPSAATYFAAPKSVPTFGLAPAAPRHAASLATMPASAAIRSHGMAVADTNAPGASLGATTTLGVEAPTRLAEPMRSADAAASDPSALAAAKPTEAPVIATTAGATALSVAAVSDSVISASAAKSDDDATVRSGAPADQPMADFAAISRRQRSLFSYTSR